MDTGSRATFVISWSQTELDGTWSAPVDDLRVGAGWSWTGEAVRVDGPADIMPLGPAAGMVELRRHAAQKVRRLLRAVETGAARPDLLDIGDPGQEQGFTLTDGRRSWTATVIRAAGARPPLLVFMGDPPPRHRECWIVSQNAAMAGPAPKGDAPGGVVCFTPGTQILTETGPRAVEALREGDRIQTKDNGCAEVLWIGQRRITGARLFAMPHLAPVRLMAGALDEGVPDAGLLVSPDHRILLRGARARALFASEEVLVAARDLINGDTIYADRSNREVGYIHLLLPQHEIVFANGVETDSFHPASAALSAMEDNHLARLLDRLPEIAADPTEYGAFARRVLSRSEAALVAAGA